MYKINMDIDTKEFLIDLKADLNNEETLYILNTITNRIIFDNVEFKFSNDISINLQTKCKIKRISKNVLVITFDNMKQINKFKFEMLNIVNKNKEVEYVYISII